MPTWPLSRLPHALAQELPSGLAAVAINPRIIDTDMLRICWAEEASQYPTPERWSESAAPFLLGLGPKNNGGNLTVPL